MAAWYYAINGERHGPVSAEQLKSLAAQGVVSREHFIWTDGLAHWHPAGNVRGLFGDEVQAGPPFEPIRGNGVDLLDRPDACIERLGKILADIHATVLRMGVGKIDYTLRAADKSRTRVSLSLRPVGSASRCEMLGGVADARGVLVQLAEQVNGAPVGLPALLQRGVTSLGPFTLGQIRKGILQGHVTADDLVAVAGAAHIRPAREIPELAAAIQKAESLGESMMQYEQSRPGRSTEYDAAGDVIWLFT